MEYTEEQKDIIRASIQGDSLCISAFSGSGKEQPLTSKILTENGWSTMGDIEIGDKVMSPNKSINTVTAIHPQGVKQVYEVHFSDNSIVECGIEHLWYVKSRTWKVQEFRTMSLKDILNTSLKAKSCHYYSVPLTSVGGEDSDLPLHPYLLGALIGDGSLRKTTCLSSHVKDKAIIDKCNTLLPKGTVTGSLRYTSINGIQQTYRSPRNKKRCKHSLKINLEKLDLQDTYSHTKFIPVSYLNSSFDQRLELLRGLMDTDGSVGNRNRLTYSTTSNKLADDLIYLVKSLGGSVTVSLYERTGKRDCFSMIIKFDTLNPFWSPRKKIKCTPRNRNTVRKRITAIIKTDRFVEQQCISLDGDNLYITDGFTTTHNSHTLFEIMKHNKDKEFLLLSFNQHLQKEYITKKRKEKIKNVSPMTLHKLAKTYTLDTGMVKFLGEEYEGVFYRLKPFIHGSKLKEMVGRGNPWKLSKELSAFCKSSKTLEFASKNVQTIFKESFDEREITHDMYMKVFHSGLVDKTIVVNNYDCAVIDECQDVSKTIFNVFKALETSQKIVVGDENQALYTFLLKDFDPFADPYLNDFKKLCLTKSFRCSTNIASKLDKYLMKYVLKTKETFVGSDYTDSTDDSHFYITRSNNSVLRLAYQLSIQEFKFRLTDTIKNLSKPILDMDYVLNNFENKYQYCSSSYAIKKVNPNIENELQLDLGVYISDKNTELSLPRYLLKHSNGTSKNAITLLNFIAGSKITVKEFLDTIAENTVLKEEDSRFLVSNAYKVKGAEANSVSLYEFKNVSELKLDCGMAIQHNILKIPKFQLNRSQQYNNELIEKYTDSDEYRDFLTEIKIIYVAISRAKTEVEFLKCNEGEYWQE